MFLYYSAAEPESFGEGVRMDFEFYNPGVSKFDLTFDVVDKNGLLSFAFEYSTELFRPETIQRFHDYITLLIDGVLDMPNRRLFEITMIPDSERQFLMPNVKETKDPWESFTGIHQMIEKMALDHPNALAVSFEESHLTYGELDRRAEVLARKIFGKTKGDNSIIGLCAERSLEMIVGLLAILKAGCAYLPIDPKYPTDRIRFMMEDADLRGLVTQRNLVSLFDASLEGIFLLDTLDAKDAKDAKDANDAKDITGVSGVSDTKDTSGTRIETLQLPVPDRSDLAYVIYTSGSTGKPKGVAISHGNILSSTAGRLDFYPVNPEAFLLLSSISFDSSKAGIFWTLCTGGNLVIAPARIEQDVARLGALIQRHKISHTLMLPSLYHLLLELGDADTLTSLSAVMVAGEACPVSLVERHFSALPTTQLYNEYGPTEATVWCIAHKIERGQTSNVPLGRPVAGAGIYLLDGHKNLVPRGAVGEIHIGGDGLSNGYVKRPELTAERFIGNPFSENAEDRLYKTGDLARYNAEGTLEFLGRTDQQIKIRGYRVELGEIEKAIRATGKLSEVVVLVEELGASSKRLVSYISSENKIEVDELKLELKRRLPDYMVPASVIQVAEMPMLPNGKIDIARLREQPSSIPTESEKTGQLPRNELEEKLLRIWSELLERDAIGIHDNFFDLGGDSILSIRLISEARKEDIQLTPNQIFDNQTIADLAEYIQDKESREEEWGYLVALRKTGSENPLFCIHAGGGHVFFYNVLTKYIGAHRPIYALQASGVYAGMDVHHSIEDMAADYIEAIRKVQPTGPYNIMAYCFSAAVGHEMLLQLRKADQHVNLIVADTMTDPWRLDTGERLKMRIKSFAKRLVANPFVTISGMIQERLVRLRIKLRKMASEGDDRALAKLNDNLAYICARYVWRPHQEKVTVLLTPKPDESINKEVVGSWEKVALGGVEVVPTEGDHIDLFAEPHVAEVAAKIEANCV